MKKTSTKNMGVYLDRSEGPISTPIRRDDGALSGDTKLATTGVSASAAVAVNDSVSRSSSPPYPGRRDHQALSAAVQQLSTRDDHRPRERGIGETTSASPSRERSSSFGEATDRSMSSVEKDAAHFKMVAARFRALMERRERRLEEAMSDPQTRTDLEAMFPGIREGDYQTLLAGVRGMEEDDFQALLEGACKRRQEQSERGMENGGDERRSSKSSGPPSPTPRPPRVRSPPPPPPPGMGAHGWVPAAGGGERRGHYYPAPGRHPAYAEQQPYHYDDRDSPFPHYTGSGARGMGRGEIGRGRAEGGRIDGVRGEAGVGGEVRDGRGLPPMWSRQSYHQWYSSSSRSGPRDPGMHLASASPAAGSGRIDEMDRVRRVGGGDPREPYYHHADRRPHDDGEGGGKGRGTLPPPPPPPFRVPDDDQMPPPSMGRPSASVPVAGGVGGGVHSSYARPPPRNREALPSVGLQPSAAVHHRPAPDHDRDPAPRYARPSASVDQTTRDAVGRTVQNRDPRGVGGAASPAIACGPPSADAAAAVSGVPGMERNGYREIGREESRAPPPDAKRVAVRLCELVERCGGNLDEVMADPGTRAELESIFPGLEEKEFRAMLRGCVERPQPPPLYRKPAERAQYDVDRPYRREAERAYPERELPYHRGGGEPEHPHYPPTRQHRGYPEMDYAYRDSRYRYLPPDERFYREPRESYPPRASAFAEHGGDGGGRRADFVLAKREVPEDLDPSYDPERDSPYPKYSMNRVRGEAGVDMPNGRGGDYSRPCPTHTAKTGGGGRSPEGLRSHPLPLPPSRPPLYQPPGRPDGDHNPPSSGGTPPPQPRRPSDPAGLILPRRDSPLQRDVIVQQHSQSHPPQSQSQTPQRSESTTNHHPALEARDFGPDSPGTRDDLGDNGGRMVDRRLPLRSASPEDRSSNMRQAVIEVGEVTPIDGGHKPFCEVVRDSSGMTRLYIPEHPPVVPRRPPSKGNKRETLNDIAHRIPVSVMRPYFNYPLRKAAEAMNISVTTLKRLCRRHGVKRWPHRQISGINRAMAHLEFQQDQAGRRNGNGLLNTQVSDQMQELLRRRRVMIEHAFESDDVGNRSQGRNSLDSDEEVMDRETYMAGDMIESQIAEDIEHPIEVHDQHSNGVAHGRASPGPADRGRSASPHAVGRAPGRQILPPPSPPPGSPLERPISPSTPSNSRRHAASSPERADARPATPPPMPQHQQQHANPHTDHEQRRHVFRHDLGEDGASEEGERYHQQQQQQREYERDMRRSERLVGPRSAPHGQDDEVVVEEERGGPKEEREMVVERRELRPLPRRGREQEEAQSLKHKQRGPPDETPPPKRQTPRSHPTKAEPPMQPKALRPGQKPPSPLTCGPRVPLRSREMGSPLEHAHSDRVASRTPPGAISDMSGYAMSGAGKETSWGCPAASTASAS